MLKKWVAIGCALFFWGIAPVWAAVDINSSDAAGLQEIKGIGASKAEAIIAERNAHGPFKDGGDLAARVKGFGLKSVTKLSGEGLTFGQPKSAGAKPAKKAKPATSKSAAK
jgi:competence protein ComEA